MHPDPDRLREIPLFEGIGTDQLEQVASWFDVEEHPAGTRLTRAGASGYAFFILMLGGMLYLQRDNPFATHHLEALEFRFPAGLDWDSFLARCATAQWRGAIVGPNGSGKSTLLEQLAPRLREFGFFPRLFRIQAETTNAQKDAIFAEIRALRPPHFLLLDGAEQLSTKQWLLVHSMASTLPGCLITIHRTGRLPTLMETQTSPALLIGLAASLHEAPLEEPSANYLFKKYSGNLRSCLRELYDYFAEINDTDPEPSSSPS